jgi:hypothetical protein
VSVFKFLLQLPDGAPHEFASRIENWAVGDVLVASGGLLVRILAIETEIADVLCAQDIRAVFTVEPVRG